MVAIIKTGHSIRRILQYNENKVKEGVAKLIAAANYPLEAAQMSFMQKLNRLQKQAALNENVTRNSVHISLNFDPCEKLSETKLQAIAESYLKAIGFDEQPCLIYQHFDAAHPHIHIVSCKVKADGSRIDMHNIGRNQSEKARKEIEQTFGLVKADGSKLQQEHYVPTPVSSQKIQYGKAVTKNAIRNVLDHVLQTYKYASLPELNAILRSYNVQADRGSENSRTYRNNGLMYRVLDAKGNKAGVPIKASDFYNKPTLDYLKKMFTVNEPAKRLHRARVRNLVDLAFVKKLVGDIDGLVKLLENQGIQTVLRQNDMGLIYGITYIDHTTKCVFNGSTLGKDYSVKGIMGRMVPVTEKAKQTSGTKLADTPTTSLKQTLPDSPATSHSMKGEDGLISILLQPEFTSGFVPYQLKSKGKKKKKKRQQRR